MYIDDVGPLQTITFRTPKTCNEIRGASAHICPHMLDWKKVWKDTHCYC